MTYEDLGRIIVDMNDTQRSQMVKAVDQDRGDFIPVIFVNRADYAEESYLFPFRPEEEEE